MLTATKAVPSAELKLSPGIFYLWRPSHQLQGSFQLTEKEISAVRNRAQFLTTKAVKAQKGTIPWDEEKVKFMIAFLQGSGLSPCLPSDAPQGEFSH
jgi:hypothetical protein